MQALAEMPRQAYYISTKFGRFELDFARAFDFRADILLENLSQSLERLMLPYVDICFLQVCFIIKIKFLFFFFIMRKIRD